MVKYLLLICFFFSIIGCSTNNSLLKKHNYAEAVNKATFRLSCDADNQRASQLLQKAYTEALVYYKNGIDRILTGNDQLKWTNALDIMQKTNDLSDEIRYNSTASQLICEPKIYTTEIADASQKAVTELYSVGNHLLNLESKEKAKEAYFYFIKAGKLNPNYKDVDQKIQEAKIQASWKVIIDPVPAHTQNNILSFSTKTLYQILFYKLREIFPYNGFIYFYSPEEAQNQKIVNPDQIVHIEISNFEVNSYQISAGKNNISQFSKKLDYIDGKYVWKKVEIDYFSGPGQQEQEREYSRLDMRGLVVLNINSFSDNNVLYKYRMPWNYSEESGYSSSSSSSSSGNDPTYLSINPDSQILFDHFSLSVCDQLVDILSDFFGQYK